MKSHGDDMEQLCKAYVDVLLGKGPVPMPFKIACKNLEIIDSVTGKQSGGKSLEQVVAKGVRPL